MTMRASRLLLRRVYSPISVRESYEFEFCFLYCYLSSTLIFETE